MNKAVISGIIIQEPTLHHSVQDKTFYSIKIVSRRRSGEVDYVPVLIDKKQTSNLHLGKSICVEGMVNTYRDTSEERHKLSVYILANKIVDFKGAEDINEVELDGEVNKTPIYRQTPFHSHITDIMLKNTDNPKRSHYIPAVFWNKDARSSKKLERTERIRLTGRFQSRPYAKKDENNVSTNHIAYELSVKQYDKI